MADAERTRTRKKTTSRILRFPEVEGKTIEAVEIDPEAQSIILLFQDNTALSFELDSSHSVFPELSDRNAGDWRKLKRWPAMHSSLSMQKWP